MSAVGMIFAAVCVVTLIGAALFDCAELLCRRWRRWRQRRRGGCHDCPFDD